MHRLHEKFARIVYLANELDKAPRTYGTNSPMSPGEIHMIELIGDNDARLSVTDIAKSTGVTKGAVSQTLKKLENKGFVIKEIDPSNLSRIIVALTSRGKTAYYAHKDWHETMDGGFKTFFSNLTNDKLQFLNEVMDKLEIFYKNIMK
ncbi:MAG: winged helix-turn-helix transcriptional regulator [Deltaproteobacteria bacterium]|nr:winged helix-turn-helix transcriptional regulator [Deltaproteobacteria bacterium]